MGKNLLIYVLTDKANILAARVSNVKNIIILEM